MSGAAKLRAPGRSATRFATGTWRHALEAAELGLRVFPCCRGTKHPHIKCYLKLATSDPARAREWWERWPAANVGVATHGLIVLDVDGPEGERVLAALELPPTLEVITRRGRHFYFAGAVPGGCVGKLAEGLDVKGNDGGKAKGLVLAPGSVVDGHRYEWANGRREIAPAPRELVELVRRAPQRRPRSRAQQGNLRPIIGVPILRGERNTTLTQYAGRLFRDGCTTEASLLGALAEINTERCRPPLDDSEVRRIAASAEGRFRESPPWCGAELEAAAWCARVGDGPDEIAVLNCLRAHGNWQTRWSWPSQKRIGRTTGLGLHRVRRALRQLEERSVIEVDRSRRGHRYRLPDRDFDAELENNGGGSSCSPGGADQSEAAK